MIKRAIVKLSGEALAGEKQQGIDFELLDKVCGVLAQAASEGYQIGVVVGAGNFWRGAKGDARRMDRTRADHMGMLATTMNAIAIGDALERAGARSMVLSATPMPAYVEGYNPDKARRALEAGYVVVMGGGTGNAFVTTDTGVILRALELKAELALMAKNVDGVYDKDPVTNPDAVRFDTLTYDEIIERGLKAIDLSAACLAKEGELSCRVFRLKAPESILEVLHGAPVGTLLKK